MFDSVPAQPDFAAQEEEIFNFWQQENIFEKSLEKNRAGEPFIIYDGPPTANAKPPLHTIVPMSFKDLVGRYQSMRGRFVPRQAGWDTHGLPVEVQIEKKLGLSSKKEVLSLVPGDEEASIRAFNDACRTSVWEFKQEWDRFVARVGYWTDTEHPYITYDPAYIEREWGIFKQIWDKGLVYRGYKVVPYCPRCGTALSSHEVAQEYRDVKEVSVYVSFPLVDRPERAVLAWTTTPWTLPGNVALAVKKEVDYVVVRQLEREYVLAKARLGILKGEYEIIEEMKGEALIGQAYEPLFPEVLANTEGRKHIILDAEFVTTDDGTGVVHTAVMYGEDDFQLGLREGLIQVHTVGLDGAFLDRVPGLAGIYVRDALGQILTYLQERGRLYAKETITHSYPFCWRCKTALLYYAKDSWFIAMSTLRESLVKANSAIEWVPEHYREGRFGDFIREARDWAISRERFWGTPLPVWISSSGKMLCVGSFAELRSLAKDPSMIGEEFDPHRPSVDGIVLVKDGEEYLREPVILDVWFDSGAMPYASGWAEQGRFPADYIAEATDQTRGWFYTLLAISVIVSDQSSYCRVVCMGLLLDEQGKKMSKSVGNVFDPWEIFQHHGVDAVRWFLYTVNAPGEAKSFGLKELSTAFRKGILLPWNVLNYFVTYANLADFTSPTEIERVELRQGKRSAPVLDRWILSRQAQVASHVTTALDAYDFLRASRSLEQYVDDLSTWYLRRSRKREDAVFFTVLYDLLFNLALLQAPMVPFLAEKIYRTLRQPEMPESVHLSEWPAQLGVVDEELLSQMSKLRLLVELGLSLRSEQKVKVRQPLAIAYIHLDTPLSTELLPILAEELNVGRVEVVTELPEGLPSRGEREMAVALDVALSDELLEAGQARELQRQLQQLRKELGMRPGQEALLVVDPTHRAVVEPLLTGYPDILTESYLRLEPDQSWKENDGREISIGGQEVSVSLVG